MAAVSDSSPIIALARCGRLDLLEQLYGRIWIPEAVRDEIAVGGAGSDAAQDVSWIQARPVVDRARVGLLYRELDAGESEAIALALETPDIEAVILDDAQARRRALGLGLSVTGTAGLFVAAKARGLVGSVRQALDDLRAVGFYLDDVVYARALQRAGE